MTEQHLDLITISRLDSQNIIATSKNFPDEAYLSNQLIGIYTQLAEDIKAKTLPEDKIVEFQLFWIILRGLFSSSGLMFSAHIAESYTIISRSLEAIGYINHIRIDPNKARVWITKKHDSEEFRKAFRPLWGKNGEMEQIKQAYDLTRRYGVHSNLHSTVFHQVRGSESKTQNVYTDIGNIKNLNRCIVYLINCYSMIFKKTLLSFGELASVELKEEYKKFEEVFKKRKSDLLSYFKDHSDLE